MKLLTEQQINSAINKLNDNEIVILPTDTIYGLSAIVNQRNEQRINELKQADIKKPLIILVSSIDDVKKDINYSQEDIEKLMDKNPTTVIFPLINDPQNTIAIRIVKRDDLKKIIKSVGPIFSTSVNKHSLAPINTKSGLEDFLDEEHVYFVDALKASPSRIYNSVTKEYIR